MQSPLLTMKLLKRSRTGIIRARVSVYFVILRLNSEDTSMPQFDSTTTLTVSEGYDLTNQNHYSKWRCRCRCCNFLYRKCCSFRLWKVLLFLFILLLIFALILLLLMRYGPGRTALSSGTDSPGGVGKVVHINSKCRLSRLRGAYGV